VTNSIMNKMQDEMTRGLETAQKQGAQGAKLSFSRGEAIGCSFSAGRLKDTEVRRSSAYVIEVLVEGKRGTTAGNDPADLPEMINRAISLARAGSPTHFSAYPAPGQIKKVKKYSGKTVKITRAGLIENCQKMVDALKRYNPDLFIEASGSRSVSEGLLVTSGGVSHHFEDTAWSLGSMAQKTEGTDMLFVGYGHSFREVNDFYNPDLITERLLFDLKHGEKIVESSEGKLPAFLPPEVLGMFLWPLVLGVNGRNVAKGDSPLRGRLGELIFDPGLTIQDDPHWDFSPGAAEIDGDGIPTRVMMMVEKGVLKNFLYDLDTAGMAGVEPTGNRGCLPYSPEVLPGVEKSGDLLAAIDDGIFIRELIGYGQSNMINGDFSGNVALGFRVQKGKIVGRVKNTMIAGNIYDLFKKNVTLSSDRDPLLRLPSAVVQGLSVSTSR